MQKLQDASYLTTQPFGKLLKVSLKYVFWILCGIALMSEIGAVTSFLVKIGTSLMSVYTIDLGWASYQHPQ